MPTTALMPLPKQQYLSALGTPLLGGKLYTFAAGTSTPKETYTDSAGTAKQPNPIPLNLRGEPDKPIFWSGNYRVELRNFVGDLIYSVDNYNTDPAGILASIGDYAKFSGASLIGFIQAGANAVLRTVENKLRERVTPQDFGAVGNGVTNDTAAVQAAIATGKLVDFGDSSNTYLITATITRTGPVRITASGGTIKADVLPMAFTDASGSRVHGLNFLPITTPYTIKRNTTTWVNTVSDVVQSLEGYLPNAQDGDLWPTLPANIKAQFDNFHPGGIKFLVSSAAGGRDVVVSGITGFQACITFEGYSDSTVRDCNFGGKREGVYFYNALGASNGGFTLPRGANNKAVGNTIRYAAQCAIVFFGNDDFTVSANTTYMNGETGIKTYQHDPATPTPVMCTNGVVDGNTSYNNYYDGIDLTNVNGIDFPGTYPTGHTATGNRSFNNRHTGMTICGSGYNVSGNIFSENGSHGLNAQGIHSSISANMARNNAAHPEIHTFQIFDMCVQGDGLNSTGNKVFNASAPSTWNYIHTGLFGVDPTPANEGQDIGNQCSHGPTRALVSPNIPSSDTLMIGYGTRNLTKSAAAIFRQGGAGAEIGGASNIGTVRIRGDATTSAQVDFATNATDAAGTPGFQGRILYDFTNNLLRFAVNGAAQSLYFQNNAGFFPSPDNVIPLGIASLRWSQVYAGNGAISTSDATEKQQARDIDAAVLRAWSRITPRQFKFNDAVELKGDGARWHFGLMAQEVKAAFEAEGLDPFAYGLLCYDEWDGRAEQIDEDGNVTVPAVAGGKRYGIRYDQAAVIWLAYLQSKMEN